MYVNGITFLNIVLFISINYYLLKKDCISFYGCCILKTVPVDVRTFKLFCLIVYQISYLQTPCFTAA